MASSTRPPWGLARGVLAPDGRSTAGHALRAAHFQTSGGAPHPPSPQGPQRYADLLRTAGQARADPMGTREQGRRGRVGGGAVIPGSHIERASHRPLSQTGPGSSGHLTRETSKRRSLHGRRGRGSTSEHKGWGVGVGGSGLDLRGRPRPAVWASASTPAPKAVPARGSPSASEETPQPVS